MGLILLLNSTVAHACGPFFPNNLLSGGDEALLAAPVADFERELARMNIASSRFKHVSATNGCGQQSLDGEMSDLATALKKAKVSDEESTRIVEAHRLNRKKLSEYLDAYRNWDSTTQVDADGNVSNPAGTSPAFPVFAEVPGLPDEFADYFEGAAALRNPNSDESDAIKAWERLLARPAAERKYKSTWAAFMLGKSWDAEDDDKALEYFQMTRDLARRGFADSIGLAAASLGLEARVELRRKHFKRAIELYLEQYATGDDSAVQSLRMASRDAAFEEAGVLAPLAANETTRKVFTAYLISRDEFYEPRQDNARGFNPIAEWLAAMEVVGVKDVEAAERFALAAYQDSEFEMAQRWVSRARGTPVAQWLQAKLYLRAGKVPQAAALFAEVAERLPVVSESETTNSTEFADSLHVITGGYDRDLNDRSARERMLGELGVLKLSRGEYEQALDALLRSGFWEDAAYVAERVLTVDELKTYVDRNWSVVNVKTNEAAIADSDTGEALQPPKPSEDIRHLLARRLSREMRSSEAREYFPTNLQSRVDELVVALNVGWNESAPAERRAKSLFEAAKIARESGMELLGTELSPDYAIHGGNYDWGLTWQERSTNSVEAKLNIASEEELNRASHHGADPEVRFHYRYQAAFLGWEAAKLMPNNSDETARVLCTAGTWLKLRDPETADIFYKALVRRCRKTAIGDQADRMRWFPVLDENGNPKPYKPVLETVETMETPSEPLSRPDETEESEAATFPMPGKAYIVQPGDSVAEIANAAAQIEPSVTLDKILEANPGLESTQIKIGQRIMIPGVEREPEPQP